MPSRRAEESFISSRVEFERVREVEAGVFRPTTGGLPDQVFASGLASFCFRNFDDMLTSDFWKVLSACAGSFDDRELFMRVREPDPDSYYFKNFKRFGVLRFTPSDSSQDYICALKDELGGNPADALTYRADTVTWFGNSGLWGFWGERELGIAVGASRRPNASWPPNANGTDWFDTNKALDMMSLNFKNRIIPSHFVRSFVGSYSNRP